MECCEFFVNYCKIGEKIRKYRKAKGLSQELLAEKVGISVTHMSHIETGNTKLGLPVLVALSIVLEVQVDDLLFDQIKGRQIAIQELDSLLSSCTDSQIRIILDIIKATKISLDKHI